MRGPLRLQYTCPQSPHTSFPSPSFLPATSPPSGITSEFSRHACAPLLRQFDAARGLGNRNQRPLCPVRQECAQRAVSRRLHRWVVRDEDPHHVFCDLVSAPSSMRIILSWASKYLTFDQSAPGHSASEVPIVTHPDKKGHDAYVIAPVWPKQRFIPGTSNCNRGCHVLVEYINYEAVRKQTRLPLCGPALFAISESESKSGRRGHPGLARALVRSRFVAS